MTTFESPQVIFHVPHSSTIIPKDIRDSVLLSDEALAEELRVITDWHTSELFSQAIESFGTSIEFPISRLIVDPERFDDDSMEAMSSLGLGVLYTKTSSGQSLRNESDMVGEHRKALLDDYYYPHHEALNAAVKAQIKNHSRALIIDCHSFPNIALPYELDQNIHRPDICIGTDPFHTTRELASKLERAFVGLGYEVKINSPFSGSIVPMDYYNNNASVQSIMIEINRSLYMVEETAEKSENFNVVQADIHMAIKEILRTMEKLETSPKSKSLPRYEGKVPRQILRGKETREYNERMGLSSSALVIPRKINQKDKDKDK